MIEAMNRSVAWAWLGGVVLLLGCGAHGRHTASADVCAGSACEQTVECELGSCHDDFVPRTVTAAHAPNAATFDDQDTSTCPYPKHELPPLEKLLDDSDIPEYNRTRSRRANHASGDQFIQDWQLHEELMRAQGAFFDCLDIAACYQDEPSSTGELDFLFELEPDGRVSAVSVDPSTGLDDPIIRACARRSVYQTRFPTWQGGRMVVSYNLAITIGNTY